MNDDRQLQQDVRQELAADPSLNAEKIGVSVSGSSVTLSGKVTIEGRVSNWAERDVIKHAVWSTAGVQSLVDKMQYGVSGLGNF